MSNVKISLALTEKKEVTLYCDNTQKVELGETKPEAKFMAESKVQVKILSPNGFQYIYNVDLH